MLLGGVLRKCLVELLTFKGNYKIGLLITKELSVYRFIFNIPRAIFLCRFFAISTSFDAKKSSFRQQKITILTLAFALAGRKRLGVA